MIAPTPTDCELNLVTSITGVHADLASSTFDIYTDGDGKDYIRVNLDTGVTWANGEEYNPKLHIEYQEGDGTVVFSTDHWFKIEVNTDPCYAASILTDTVDDISISIEGASQTWTADWSTNFLDNVMNEMGSSCPDYDSAT
jgi:hypothetical protein